VIDWPAQSVTNLLGQWRSGDAQALESLLPLVYQELRRIAHGYLNKERPGHTLQSTALVHEAFIRLVKQSGATFENRAHFFAISAGLMRQILVEYARSRATAKRAGGQRLDIEVAALQAKSPGVDVVALDDTLKELAKLDEQQSRIVELRFFGGLSIEETARALGISPATVKRDWVMARVWLHHQISRSGNT
jgi:RNA polymerase sigma factor (TIGR02999 family)